MIAAASTKVNEIVPLRTKKGQITVWNGGVDFITKPNDSGISNVIQSNRTVDKGCVNKEDVCDADRFVIGMIMQEEQVVARRIHFKWRLYLFL